MKKLGYYAKDSQNNLFQYEWGADDEFYILNSDRDMVMADPNKYDVLEIGYFDSQDNLNKTEQRLKENLIKDIYNTDVKLHYSYDVLYDDLIHKSVERLENILDGIKYNHYICTNY